MKIRHKNNGGLAEVSDEYGKILVSSGAWEDLNAPAPAAPKRTPKKAAQKPAEAPKPSE